jgi:hypothetical protein
MCSDSALGYFLQFKDLNGRIRHFAFPFFSNLKKVQVFGSLQHSPHRTHLPLRFFDIGNREVAVLFALAPQVFLFLPAMEL